MLAALKKQQWRSATCEAGGVKKIDGKKPASINWRALYLDVPSGLKVRSARAVAPAKAQLQFGVVGADVVDLLFLFGRDVGVASVQDG